MDSDVLRPYTPAPVPALQGSGERHLTRELAKVQQSLSLAIQVIKQLEARVAALEP